MKNKPYPLYEIKEIETLKELIDYRAAESPDAIAFAWRESEKRKEKTYRQLQKDVICLVKRLERENAQSTRVAILGENSYDWLLAFFAIVYGGNVAVPIDRELSSGAVARLLMDSGSTHLIYSNTYRDIAETVCSERNLCAINMKELDQMLSEDSIQNCGAKTDPASDTPVLPETLAAIIYTSGTTGEGKGVMLSHGNFALDTCAACRNYRLFGNTLLLLPLHHSFGLVAGVFMTLLYGYTVSINISLKNLLRDLAEAKPQNLFVVPLFVESLYKQICLYAAKQGTTGKEVLGGNLDTIVSGGAPLNAKYVQGFRDLGIQLLNGYGITECSPVVSVNRNEYYRDGSVGQVLSACTVQIEGADKHGVGEICVKGPIIMQGYYGKPDETKEAVVDGWFHTGDLGYLDADGFLFITGRKKNLIVLDNGENVAPEELEFLFSDYLLIKEVIVYEREHRIVAEVYPDEEYLQLHPELSAREELQNILVKINRSLPVFKQISSVIIRDSEFEKTTTKKIKRDIVGGKKNV